MLHLSLPSLFALVRFLDISRSRWLQRQVSSSFLRSLRRCTRRGCARSFVSGALSISSGSVFFSTLRCCLSLFQLYSPLLFFNSVCARTLSPILSLSSSVCFLFSTRPASVVLSSPQPHPLLSSLFLLSFSFSPHPITTLCIHTHRLTHTLTTTIMSDEEDFGEQIPLDESYDENYEPSSEGSLFLPLL